MMYLWFGSQILNIEKKMCLYRILNAFDWIIVGTFEEYLAKVK